MANSRNSQSLRSLNFTDDGIIQTLPVFYETNKHRFPMMAAIVLGIYTPIEIDSFCGGQVLYIHGEQSQRRVVARDTNNRVFSIPMDYRLKFKVVKSRNVHGEEQTLQEVVAQNALPVQVKLAVDKNTAFYIGEDQQRAGAFHNMVLVKEFDERYLLVNCVVFDRINERTVPLPMYLTEMTLSRVTGIEGYSEEEWQDYLAEVREDMKKAVCDPNKMSNKEIAYYSDNFELNDDSIYESLIPNDYLMTKRNEFENDYCEIEGPPPPLPQRARAKSEEESNKETEPHHNYKNVKPKKEVPPFRIFHSLTKDILPWKSEDIPLQEMSISELGKALKEMKLERHVTPFKKARIDGRIATDLTSDILSTEFGFSGLEVIKMMAFINAGHIPK